MTQLPAAHRDGDDAALEKDLRAQGCGLELGRYTILRKIAAGGMAELYVAHAKGVSGFAKKVAIKKILPQFSHNRHFVAMLLDEAKISVSLTHPNIAQVYELGVDATGAYFIVMEYVDGLPLHRVLRRLVEKRQKGLPIAHAAHIIAEVAKGLDHAHRQKDQHGASLGIVHRDVSPQNVLLSYQGSVKLIDFGIARAEGRLGQTGHGIIKGKLKYLAPEIAAGREPDLRADIYCCGLVLFELLTGEPMYSPKSDLSALEMAKQARVRSPRSVNPEVPPELDAIVMCALQRDREERYASAKELYADLRVFLNRHAPVFNESELGDSMQAMFQAEISDARRLDLIADRIAGGAPINPFHDEPTVAVDEAKLYLAVKGEGELPRGKLHLDGADGGRAMSIVLADDVVPAGAAPFTAVKAAASRPVSARPADARPADGRPGTAAPKNAMTARPSIEGAITSKRNWDNPLIETLPEDGGDPEAGTTPPSADTTGSGPLDSADRTSGAHGEAQISEEFASSFELPFGESFDFERPSADQLAPLEAGSELELQSALDSKSRVAAALAQPLPGALTQVPTATLVRPSGDHPVLDTIADRPSTKSGPRAAVTAPIAPPAPAAATDTMPPPTTSAPRLTASEKPPAKRRRPPPSPKVLLLIGGSFVLSALVVAFSLATSAEPTQDRAARQEQPLADREPDRAAVADRDPQDQAVADPRDRDPLVDQRDNVQRDRELRDRGDSVQRDRELRDPRDVQRDRELRDQRDSVQRDRELRDPRDVQRDRELRDPRDSVQRDRELRDQRDSVQRNRELRDPRDVQRDRELRDPRDVQRDRELRDQRDNVQRDRELRDPRDVQRDRELRDQRDSVQRDRDLRAHGDREQQERGDRSVPQDEQRERSERDQQDRSKREQGEREPSAETLGSILINSRPVSTIYLDGKKKGRTPMTLTMRPGKHDITLESPDGLLSEQTRKVTAGKNPPLIWRWK